MFNIIKIIITLLLIVLTVICVIYSKVNKSYMISIIGLFIMAGSLTVLFTSKTNVFASENINITDASITEIDTELSNYYPALTVVTEINTETDCVTIMTVPDGNLWDFSGVEDWSTGDLAVCIFSDNVTPYYLEDDVLMPTENRTRYVGYVDGENSTSETGEKLLWFEFSSTYWDLTENYL